MNTATHKSACGKWLYKTDEKLYPDVPYRTFQFWDVHCSKWRLSHMTEAFLVPINDKQPVHSSMTKLIFALDECGVDYDMNQRDGQVEIHIQDTQSSDQGVGLYFDNGKFVCQD